MKTVCIVQARLGSARLPGKVLLPLGDHTVLWQVLSRCKKIRGIDEVVCAVPDEQRSIKITNEAERLCVRSFLGSELDVLSRYYRAAIFARGDVVMRVTADCPLIDPEVCGRVLDLLHEIGGDYASNVHPRGYPKGLDCEVFTFDALRRAHEQATDAYDREHVTPYMVRTMKTANLPGRPEDAGYRLTLDTPDDYEYLSHIFDAGKIPKAGNAHRSYLVWQDAGLPMAGETACTTS